MTDENAPTSSVPLTLAERARAAQRLWVAAHTQEHRVRRAVSWMVAAILAVCMTSCLFRILVGVDMFPRLMVTVVAGWVPLMCIAFAAEARRKGDHSGFYWRRAWVFLVLDAAAGSELFSKGEYLLGVSYVVSALGIGAVLAGGLHIPDDPSVDWDLVCWDQLTVVRSARGGRLYAPIIDSPRKAEEMAAAWLRRLGYRDALVTRVGADDGVDAGSFGAVAQVKWTARRVGAPAVRDLAGTGKPGQARFFFSKSGYTKPAIRWAVDPEHRVQLFIMGDDGNIFACNYRARRALWHAPSHIPVASRSPVPRWQARVSIVLGALMPVNAVILASVTVWSFLAGQVLAGMLIGLIALIATAISVSIVFLPTVRIIRNVRSGQPAEIRESFRPRRPPEVDEGLPPDAFVGFEPDLIGRIFDWWVDFWAHSSAVHRVLRGRRRFSRNVSGSSR